MPKGGQEEITGILAAASFDICSLSVSYSETPRQRQMTCEVRWRGLPGEPSLPAFVKQFAENPTMLKVDWHPLGAPV